MIVEGMTYQEIIKEYYNIWEEARKTTLNNFDRRPYERFFRKNRKATNVYFKERRIKIDNNTNLYVIPAAPNKAYFDKYGVRFTSFLTYFTSKGQYVVMKGVSRVNGEPDYTFYTPHFFDRYRERYLKNEEMDKVSAVLHFMRNNNQESRHIYHGEYKDYEHHFVGTCDTGMTLGVFVEDKIAIYKTFLPREDLSKKKADTMEGLDEVYKKREDKFENIKQMILSDSKLLNSLRNDPLVAAMLMQ